MFDKIEKGWEKVKSFFTRLFRKANENKFFSAVFGWIKRNRMFVLYVLFAILIEMASVWTVEGDPFMSRPLLALGVLVAVGALILFIPNDRVRMIVYAVLLGLQGVVDIGFIIVYDLTGQYFDYSMLNLRNDAASMIESLPVNFFTFYVSFFFCAVYVVYGLRTTVWKEVLPTKVRSIIFRVTAFVIGFVTFAGSFVSYYPIRNVDKYKEMVDGSADSEYSAYGIVGNLLGEFTASLFKDKSKMPDKDIENFIYAQDKISTPTEHFGIAKDKNVVMVLAESLEYYSFLYNAELYGHKNVLGLTNEQYKELFPTLHWLYENAVVMNNFHAREKTDISETLSIMGSYPTEGYVNYDYSKNTLPTTVPNVLNALYGEKNIQVKSYHNGFKTFYNRDAVHPQFGFENITDMYDMAEQAYNEAYKLAKAEGKSDKEAKEYAEENARFKNYMNEGERNLDGEMVGYKKEEMFPTDKHFYTYITSITMHGVYYGRNSLAREEALLSQMMGNSKPNISSDKFASDEEFMKAVLYHYTTTALEFEESMKIMFDYLNNTEDKRNGGKLIDNTTVVIFADHNAYYHKLTNHVKDIYNFDTDNKYTELYNVPFMIYDKELIQARGAENRVVDKFVCTADIVPTLLDLLGIKYYTNMYYGNSVFSDSQSVLYSRAYGQFISDGIVGKTVNNITYQYTDKTLVNDEKIAQYKTTGAGLVQKIKHCDYIFRQNYFGNKKNLAYYYEELKKIQTQSFAV